MFPSHRSLIVSCCLARRILVHLHRAWQERHGFAFCNWTLQPQHHNRRRDCGTEFEVACKKIVPLHYIALTKHRRPHRRHSLAIADRGRDRGQRGGRGSVLSHGASSTGSGPDGPICFDFQRGCCKRTNCKFSHIDRVHPEDRDFTPIKVAVDPEKQREARKAYNA